MAVTAISSSESTEVAEESGHIELPLAAAKVLYRMIADIRRAAEQGAEAA